MKTAIFLPNPLSKEADNAAKALGLTRSKLIQTALKEYLERRRAAKVTAALNRSLQSIPTRSIHSCSISLSRA